MNFSAYSSVGDFQGRCFLLFFYVWEVHQKPYVLFISLIVLITKKNAKSYYVVGCSCVYDKSLYSFVLIFI